MTSNNKTAIKKLPVLKFSLITLLTLAVLFPSLFAIITRNFVPLAFARDVGVTAALNVCSVLLIYSINFSFNQIFRQKVNAWFRYPLEYTLVMYVSFWYLYLFYRIMTGDENYAAYLLNVGWQYRQYIVMNLIGASFTYMFITGLNLYQMMQEKAAQAERLEKEYAQVRLQALRSQVNPHFLFNSLSVLSSLVHVDAATSEKFIVQLSKAYRYILDQKDAEMVTLKSELDFLGSYFFLLQIRFNNKVLLHNKVHADKEAYMLPPLTLQLLVENAVKHNKMSASEPLEITIYDNDNRIVVENNVNVRDQHEASTGIGLDNIRKRIAFISKESVIIEQNDLQFKVSVPLKKIN